MRAPHGRCSGRRRRSDSWRRNDRRSCFWRRRDDAGRELPTEIERYGARFALSKLDDLLLASAAGGSYDAVLAWVETTRSAYRLAGHQLIVDSHFGASAGCDVRQIHRYGRNPPRQLLGQLGCTLARALHAIRLASFDRNAIYGEQDLARLD